MITIPGRILENRYTTTEWSSSNPVLADRVAGYDSVVMQYKIGDGVTAWNDLPYWGAVAPAAQVHIFDIPSGSSWPYHISYASWPAFGPNTIFLYTVNLSGDDWTEFKDFTKVSKYTGTTFNGFDFSGNIGDDGVTSGFASRIIMISAPGGSSGGSGGGGTDLITANNEWQGQNVFDQSPKLKNGSNTLQITAPSLGANRVKTFSDKTGTIADVSDVPVVKPLSGTSDGFTNPIVIAHGITAFTPTVSNCQPKDAATASSFCWSKINGSNVEIWYTGLVPSAGAVNYSGVFQA